MLSLFFLYISSHLFRFQCNRILHLSQRLSLWLSFLRIFFGRCEHMTDNVITCERKLHLFTWTCIFLLSGKVYSNRDVRLLWIRQYSCRGCLHGGASVCGSLQTRRYLRGGATSCHQRQSGRLPHSVHSRWQFFILYHCVLECMLVRQNVNYYRDIQWILPSLDQGIASRLLLDQGRTQQTSIWLR